MPVEVTMPQLSDTMTEGTVVKWHKQEGDKVKEGEKIADVETDKAVMEMEAFEGGTLAHIAVSEGGKIGVGGTIAILATGKENPAEVKTKYAGGAVAAGGLRAAPEKAVQSTAVPSIAKPLAAEPQLATAVATLESAASSEVHEPDSVGHGATREHPHAVPAIANNNGHGSNGGRIFATPLARRIAADKKVDLTGITGTGPGGRIVKADVETYTPPPAVSRERSERPAASTTPPPARIATGEKQILPLSKMRTVIAKALQTSKQNLPHFYESIDVDVEEISALRERLNASLEKEKIRLSLGDLIAKAVAVALLRHPGVNAHYDEKNAQIIRYGDVNLGMAVALPEGLIVPVLRGVNQMGFKEIRQRSADLIDRARAQKLKQDEMTGATFTVSNLGTFGVKEFSAIINPPEVGILAIAAAEKRAVVRDGQIVARSTMTITLSADHRALDGAAAADFLRTLKGLLEEPGMMLV